MAHHQLEEMVRKAVREHGQPEAVAERLLSWFDEITAGNERLEDRPKSQARVKAVLHAMRVEGDENEGRED